MIGWSRLSTNQAPAERRGRVLIVDYALAGDHGPCPCQGMAAARHHVHSWTAHEVATCGAAVAQLLTANPYARVLGIREEAL